MKKDFPLPLFLTLSLLYLQYITKKNKGPVIFRM